MNNDTIQTKGKFKIRVIRTDGSIKYESDWIHNIITSVGKAAMAAGTGNVGAVAAFTYLAVGSSSTAVAITDTTLGSEITTNGLARTSATTSLTTTTTTNDTLNFVHTWSVTGTQTVQEIGIFNAASVGTLLAHALTGAISLLNTDQLAVTYTVQFT